MTEAHYIEQIKKSITFIFHVKDNEVKALGTGFFVGVKVNSTGGYITYLVTAKHVLISDNGDILTTVYLRLNRQNDAPLVKLTFDRSSVLMHHDINVDLVCIPVTLDEQNFDVLYIPNSYFAGVEIIREKGIAEGTNIFYGGLFDPYIGFQKNYPVFRFGRVSSLPNEKIRITKPTEPLKMAHLYLFETHAFAGFSGAPVFFELDRLSQLNTIRYGNPEVYLAGIMKGHYKDLIYDSLLESSQNNDYILREINLGIAAVTPCYLLMEIVFSAAEISARENVEINPNRKNFIQNIRLE